VGGTIFIQSILLIPAHPVFSRISQDAEDEQDKKDVSSMGEDQQW
jgi:hypothetical protein